MGREYTTTISIEQTIVTNLSEAASIVRALRSEPISFSAPYASQLSSYSPSTSPLSSFSFLLRLDHSGATSIPSSSS